MTPSELKRMKKAEVADILEGHGLPAEGTREQMIARAEKAIFINTEANPEPVEMRGGAKVVQMQVTVPDVPDDAINVIATEKGQVRGISGVVRPGFAFKISPARFSRRWMRPADDAAARKIQELGK